MTAENSSTGEGGEAPPTSGLADSIRALFPNEPSEPRPDPRAASAAARDRFTTRVAEYLRAERGERPEITAGILEDARRLHGPDDLRAVGDGVVALVLAAKEGDDREARVLAEALLDSQVATHFAARLGMERDPVIRESLVAVAAELPKALSPALAGVLAEAPDRHVRRALMDVLGVLGEHGRQAVLGLLDDPRWYAVRNGVILLGEIGDADTVQALTVPLANEDPRVRRETVMTLAKLGGENAGLLILGMLGDASEDVRAAAAMGVGELRVEKAQKPLLELLAGDDNEAVLVQVLRALGQLGDPGAVPLVERRATGSLFSKPPRAVRIAAFRALAAIGTPHARTVLEAGASDKDLEVRLAVEGVLRGVHRTEPALVSGDEGDA